MPIYEYRCHSCGKKFEAMQKFSDEPLTVHPECGGGPVDRLLSVPALQFKGSGWYVNDYAKGGSVKSEPKSEAKSDTAKSDTSSSKTDSTSAPAPAAPAASSSGSDSSK
jgi:putative FmdB family regulatory protein